MRKTAAVLMACIMAVGITTAASAGGSGKVTLCHAAGLDGTTHYVTITVGWKAAYGPAGHFYENGTPRAGHEQDYLGECESEEELHIYRVVAGMPRYRGERFYAPDGITCEVLYGNGEWSTLCPQGTGHEDSGELRARTYVRLRDRTDGSVVVLIDLR